MSNSNNVWPAIGASVPVRCIALFIDIRNSSIIELFKNDGDLKARTENFIKSVKKIWEEENGPVPNSVRSYGDGLFCVVETDEDEVKIKILEICKKLNDTLSKKTDNGERLGPVGIGLSFGSATAASLSTSDANIKDYYGDIINVAAKLQAMAKPSGVVVHSEYLRNNPYAYEGFERRAYAGLGLVKDNQNIDAWVTKDVNPHHKWTCLAWPGFAVKAENGRAGLNLKGISVLTHEGLEGKIGTLEIWPRNQEREEHGDKFELIIEDYDGLQELVKQKAISLERVINGNRILIAPPLLTATRGEFYYKPIRCGLNAAAYNDAFYKSRQDEIDGLEKYINLIEMRSSSPGLNIGIYDNMGASLAPLLYDFLETEDQCNQLYTISIGDTGKKLLSFLENKQQVLQRNMGFETHKLFKIYDKIDNLSTAIQSKSIDAVIGGGAWLGSPIREECDPIYVNIPSNSKGFVWIEGAAIIDENHQHINELRKFLQEVLLDEDYQESLITHSQYGSVPASDKILKNILGDKSGMKNVKKAEDLISNEAKMIFNLSENAVSLSKNVIIRKMPAHDLNGWRKVWEEIKINYCEKPT